MGLHFFRVPWIMDGPWYTTWLTSFVLLVLFLFFFYGMWYGLVVVSPPSAGSPSDGRPGPGRGRPLGVMPYSDGRESSQGPPAAGGYAPPAAWGRPARPAGAPGRG